MESRSKPKISPGKKPRIEIPQTQRVLALPSQLHAQQFGLRADELVEGACIKAQLVYYFLMPSSVM